MKTKRILAAALLFCLLVSCITPVQTDAAYDTYTEGYYTYFVRKGEAVIFDCSSSISGDITIPSTLGGYPVTSINNHAFQYCSRLTSVTIPDGVTGIGIYAFEHCNRLASVMIPDSVTYIGSYAFYCCYGLTTVMIPDSVTGMGRYAFLSCDSLTLIIYCGTQAQWDAIEGHSENTGLRTVTRQYHDYQDATCTTPKICSICGTADGEPAGHSGNWQPIIAATMCTDGLEACICDTCGETVTRPIPAIHSYEVVVIAPTCTEDGYTAKTCTACGNQTVTDQTEATGHSYNSVVTAPTCTKDGYTTHTCTTCGDSYVGSYVDGGHCYEAVVTAPTCTTGGYTTHTCAGCGDSYVDSYVDAKGHTWSDWLQTVAPTCTAEGSRLRFCNCGVQETGAIEKLPHSYVSGVCTGCGEKENHDHTWEDGACTVCGQQLAEAIELSGDGKVTAFDAQILAEATAGLRELTDEQWRALGALTPTDIMDYVLGRFSGMQKEE